MNAVIWLLISKRRFHRGGREWRLYSINMIQHQIYGGQWHYIVAGIKGGKNTGRRNKKNDHNHQPLYVREGSLLYNAFKHHHRVRGTKKSDALFLHPLDRWQV